MSEIDDECLTVAALGRPFRLGSLYDCASDKLLSGITVFDEATLNKKPFQPQNYTHFEVMRSDSINAKTSALDLSANLKLSFLSGLLSLSGSGNYLKKKSSSFCEESLDVKFECTTRQEELNVPLKKLKAQYEEVIDDEVSATHFVTSIVYGGYAFFQFHEEASSKSKEKAIGTHIELKEWMLSMLEGKGKSEYHDNKSKHLGQFRCTYIGDFRPSKCPSSFEDAMQLYEDIPTLLGPKGEHAVPIKVTMYPLAKLVTKASKLVHKVREELVTEIEQTIEGLLRLKEQGTDLMLTDIAKKLPRIKNEIKQFKDLLEKFERKLEVTLSELVPSIRSGRKEVEALECLLDDNKSSPFSLEALSSWMDRKEAQVDILSTLTATLTAVRYASKPGTLKSAVHNCSRNSHIICFSILLPRSNRHLLKMKRYLKGDESSDFTAEGKADKLDMTVMMKKAALFRDFVLANSDSSHITFFVEDGLSDSEEFQAKITVYKNSMGQDFEFPAAPSNVRIVEEQTSHNSITVTWDPDTAQYKISCQPDIGNTITETTSANPCTINNLEADREYRVSVQRLSEVGLSFPTEAEKSVKTKPLSPPGKPDVWPISRTRIGIRWSEPSAIDPQCVIINYVIIEQQWDGSTWTQRNLTPVLSNNATLAVTPNVKYRFKVYCNCEREGVSLESDPSDEINTNILSQEYTKVNLCKGSKLVREVSFYQLNLTEVDDYCDSGIQNFEFGSKRHNMQEKVIALIGTAQSGKTALINGIVNYIFGVEQDDKFCFKLIEDPNNQKQDEHNLEKLSCYTIHYQEGFKVSYTLRIIDIPEFHDLASIDRYTGIKKQMCEFSTTPGIGGINSLDALCIVTQSSPPKDIVLDHVLSIFGKDIYDNVFYIHNVCHDQTPDVKKDFRFNKKMFGNAAQVIEDRTDGANNYNSPFQQIDTIFWQMEEQNFEHFVRELNDTRPNNLRLTNKVIHSHYLLEAALVNIKNETDVVMRLFNLLFYGKKHVNWDEDFEWTVTKIEKEKIDMPPDQQAVNCPKCSVTCRIVYQNSSPIANEERCNFCSCLWTNHERCSHRYLSRSVQTKETNETMKLLCQRYVDKEMLVDEEIKDYQHQLCNVEKKVKENIRTAKECLEFLKSETLVEDPLHKVNFIDSLIKSEETEANLGWQARSNKLWEARKKAKFIEKLGGDKLKPFYTRINEKLKEKMFYRGSHILRSCIKNSGLLNIYLQFCKLEMLQQ